MNTAAPLAPRDPADTLRNLEAPGGRARSFAVVVTAPSTAATYGHCLGMADEGGLDIFRFFAWVRPGLPADGTNYYTFKPWVVDAKGNQRFLGTPRSTATLSIPALTPFRLHEEDNVRMRVPKGGAFGVDITVSGTVAIINRISLLANGYYNG